MITYHKGDLLNSNCEIICHQVNLQGIMGHGLALQIAKRYPLCEKTYKEYTNYANGGFIYIYSIDENHFIANCFSQEINYNTNYKWVEMCFNQIKAMAKSHNIKTIGIPKNYGCGIAHGDWLTVEQIFKDIFENEQEIELQIYELNKLHTENKEQL